MLDRSEYIVCPACGGVGDFLHEGEKVTLCTYCEGVGLTKKEKGNVQDIGRGREETVQEMGPG